MYTYMNVCICVCLCESICENILEFICINVYVCGQAWICAYGLHVQVCVRECVLKILILLKLTLGSNDVFLSLE